MENSSVCTSNVSVGLPKIHFEEFQPLQLRFEVLYSTVHRALYNPSNLLPVPVAGFHVKDIFAES